MKSALVALFVIVGVLRTDGEEVKEGVNLLSARLLNAWVNYSPHSYSMNYEETLRYPIQKEASSSVELTTSRIAKKWFVDGDKFSFEQNLLDKENPRKIVFKFDGKTYSQSVDDYMSISRDVNKFKQELLAACSANPLALPYRFLFFNADSSRNPQDIDVALVTDFLGCITSVSEESQDGKNIVILHAKTADQGQWVIRLDKTNNYFPYYSDYTLGEVHNINEVAKYRKVGEFIIPESFEHRHFESNILTSQSSKLISNFLATDLPKEVFSPVVHSVIQVWDMDFNVTIKAGPKDSNSGALILNEN